jgi:hypothetical protein
MSAPIQIKIPNVATSAGPSWTVHNDRLCLAWKGEPSDPGIYVNFTTTLQPNAEGLYDFTPQQKILNLGTTTSPTIASLNGVLCLFYRGESDDFISWASSEDDGQTWIDEHQLGLGFTLSAVLTSHPETSAAPNAHTKSGIIWIAWKGAQDSQIFWTASGSIGGTALESFFPEASITQSQSTATTDSSPAITLSGKTLHVCWKSDGASSIFWSRGSALKYGATTPNIFVDEGVPCPLDGQLGTAWSLPTEISTGASSSPSLTTDPNGVVFLAWTSATAQIFRATLGQGQSWAFLGPRFGVGSSDRPTLVSTGPGSQNIMMAWKGLGTDTSIYYGVLQRPGSFNLTCLLAGSSGTRVYYLDETGFVKEAVWTNGQLSLTPQWGGSLPAAVPSGLTCLYISDVGSRVYYADPNNEIIEMALDGTSSKFTPCRLTVDAGTAMTCLLAGSAGTRVYYLATKNNQTFVNELVMQGGPSGPTPLGSGVLPAHPDSSLTCLYVSDSGSRVYYLDPNNQIIEMALDYLISSLAPEGLYPHFTPSGASTSPGSALTCLLAGSAGTRVYYLAQTNQKTFVREVCFVGGAPSITPLWPKAVPANPGSAVTCLYIDDVGSRVYYLNEDKHVVEMALDGTAATFTVTPAVAISDSPLTCLYIGDVGSRVYYVGTDLQVHELSVDAGTPSISSESFQI